MHNVEAIRTYTRPSELRALLDLAAACPRDGIALEIGSYLGASSCYIVAGISRSDGCLMCVDTWQNETMPEGEYDTLAEFRKNTSAIQKKIILLKKRSDELEDSDIPKPVNLIFIDGDHSYATSKADFEKVSPWLAEGGAIAFHDHACFQGVARVIGEALATGGWAIAGCTDNLLWIKRTKWWSTE